jgi:hypothetical protein
VTLQKDYELVLPLAKARGSARAPARKGSSERTGAK